MRVRDALALDGPRAQVAALFRRLIPLAQGPRFDDLPQAAQDVHCVVLWTGEVSNGGHRLFFDGPAGDRALRTLEALVRLGAPAAAIDLFRQALALFDEGRPPADAGARQDWLAAHAEAAHQVFDALDAALSAGVDALLEAVAAYAARVADDLALIDRYPSGLKALDLPRDLRLTAVYEVSPPERCAEVYGELADRQSRGETLGEAARTFWLSYAALAAMLQGHTRALVDGHADLALGEAVTAIERTQPPAVVKAALDLLAAAGRDAAEDELDRLQDALASTTDALLEALARHAALLGGDLPPPPTPDPFLLVTAAAFVLRAPWRPRPLDGAPATFLDAFDVVDEASADGVLGYLFTASADRCDEAKRALAAVGADEVVTLLREAEALLPGGRAAADTTARRAQLKALDAGAQATASALDGRFQALRSDAIRRLAAWVDAHRTAFDPA